MAYDHSTEPDGPYGWILLPPDAVPHQWQQRAQTVALIPLLPHEGRQILANQSASPEVDPDDEALIRYLVAGLPTREIALRLGTSERSVERRTARLRDHFGLASKEELSLFLARRGL